MTNNTNLINHDQPVITPKISIITATFNAERYLAHTIESVISQSYANIEYIIVDGGSTDSTLRIISRYKSHIDFFISEPDQGIADAMNKGLRMVTGDYVLFLHSDDYLINSSALEIAARYFNNCFQIYLFKVQLSDGNSHTLSVNRTLGWMTNFKMGSCHQGQICSARLYREIGLFDTDFRIDMDYDFILRAYQSGARCTSADKTLSVMRLGGISSRNTWVGLQERFDEERRVHFKNCRSQWMKIIYCCYWALYLPYRKIRYKIAEKININDRRDTNVSL